MALWDLCLASLMPRLSAETAFEKCSDLCERDSFSNFKASDWRAGACRILPKDSGWRTPSSLSLCLAKAGGKHLYHFFSISFISLFFRFQRMPSLHPTPCLTLECQYLPEWSFHTHLASWVLQLQPGGNPLITWLGRLVGRGCLLSWDPLDCKNRRDSS